MRHRHSGHSLLTRKVSAWDVGGAKSGDVTLQMGAERGCAGMGRLWRCEGGMRSARFSDFQVQGWKDPVDRRERFALEKLLHWPMDTCACVHKLLPISGSRPRPHARLSCIHTETAACPHSAQQLWQCLLLLSRSYPQLPAPHRALRQRACSVCLPWLPIPAEGCARTGKGA